MSGRTVGTTRSTRRARDVSGKSKFKPTINYAIGFIEGDGSIYKNRNQYRFLLNQKTKQPLIDISQLLYKHGIKTVENKHLPLKYTGGKKCNYYYISSQRDTNIKNIRSMRENVDYKDFNFWCGFFDAEGCFFVKYYPKYNKAHYKFEVRQKNPFLLKKFVEIYNLGVVRYCSKQNIFELTIGSINSGHRLIELINKSNGFHPEAKLYPRYICYKNTIYNLLESSGRPNYMNCPKCNNQILAGITIHRRTWESVLNQTS